MKRDCFAFNGRECAALSERICEHCSFYKTAGQMSAEDDAVKERISSLSAEEQAHIRDKYNLRNAYR